MKWFYVLSILLFFLKGSAFSQDELSLAVEFNSHAAAFYVALDQGLFERENLRIKSHEAYITGVALASSLRKGSIEGAYMCLSPAISAYANGGIRIKILCGTHLYGYGLAVNPNSIRTVKDLEKHGLKIGCVAEGSGTDLILRKTIEKYGLDENRLLSSVVRMNPPNMLLALRSGSIDAAFLPEHFLTLAERDGFKILLTAKDVWPNFQGSVLVVKEDVLKDKQEAIKKLMFATKMATDWINSHREEASKVLSRYLSLETSRSGFNEKIDPKAQVSIKDREVLISMSRLEYTTLTNKNTVQDIIDFMAKKGYIREPFQAEKVLRSAF